VIQNSKKKTNEFADSFQTVLLEVVQRIWSDLSSKDKASVTRMLDIWEQRKVFNASFCTSLKNATATQGPKKTTPAPSTSHNNNNTRHTHPVAKALHQLEEVINENESGDKTLKTASTYKQSYTQILEQSRKDEKQLEEMDSHQLREMQSDYEQHLKKFSDLKYALVKENDKRKEFVRALQEELKTQKTLIDQFDQNIKVFSFSFVITCVSRSGQTIL
jgi:vacuolar-type H+-ATPase subunit I/STV1